MGKRTDVCFPDDGPLRVKVQSNVRRFGRQTKIIKGSFQSKAASNIFCSSVEMNRSVLFSRLVCPSGRVSSRTEATLRVRIPILLGSIFYIFLQTKTFHRAAKHFEKNNNEQRQDSNSAKALIIALITYIFIFLFSESE